MHSSPRFGLTTLVGAVRKFEAGLKGNLTLKSTENCGWWREISELECRVMQRTAPTAGIMVAKYDKDGLTK